MQPEPAYISQRAYSQSKQMDLVTQFFQPAANVLQTPLSFSKYTLLVKPHPSLALIKDILDLPQEVSYLQTQINHKGRIVILGSAEASALTSALARFDLGRFGSGLSLAESLKEVGSSLGEEQLWSKLEIVPARMHVGPPRSLDNRVACYQGLQLPPVEEFFREIEDAQSQLLIADLLREGQKSDVQEAVYYLFNYLPTKALISVSHQEDDSTPLGRIAKLNTPNLEGVVPEEVTHLVLSDPLASGVTHFYALKYFVQKLPNLKKVLIVSPHLTKYGSLNLCRYLDQLDLDLTLLGYGALLNSRPPDYYFSPTPVDQPEMFVDSRRASLMKQIYSDLAKDLGVAGNWTAMFLSPSEAEKWFKREWEELGGDWSKLQARLADQSEMRDLLRQSELKLEDLIPASSWLELINSASQ